MNFLNIIAAAKQMLDFKLSNPEPSLLLLHPHPSELSAFRKVTATENSLPPPETLPDSNSMNAILEQRQRLINEFLQLNIQMLEKEIQGQAPPTHSRLSQECPQSLPEGEVESESRQKKIKKAVNCGHEDRPHYAKGMCSNCYHRYGRVKRPWRCPHEKLYAAGLCQNCYINDYNRRRREQSKQEEKEPMGGDSPTSTALPNDLCPQ